MIVSAEVDGVAVTSGSLSQTDLRHSSVVDVDLRGADLSYSVLDFADFRSADLSDADLTGANLSHAYLTGTKLDRANFRNVDLSGAVLEPSSIDGLIGIETAKHLETVTFETNPSGLIQLRKLLRDQGLQEQERKLTYAINYKQTNLAPLIERWFKTVAFDMTCQYGMSPGRCCA